MSKTCRLTFYRKQWAKKGCPVESTPLLHLRSASGRYTPIEDTVRDSSGLRELAVVSAEPAAHGARNDHTPVQAEIRRGDAVLSDGALILPDLRGSRLSIVGGRWRGRYNVAKLIEARRREAVRLLHMLKRDGQ